MQRSVYPSKWQDTQISLGMWRPVEAFNIASGRWLSDSELKRRIALHCPINTNFKKTEDGRPVEFVDIWPLAQKDPLAASELYRRLADQLKTAHIDHIFGTESRGFHFAGVLADRLGLPWSPVRKAGSEQEPKQSIPGNVVAGTTSSEYSSGENKDLFNIHMQDLRGKTATFIDDLLATGGTVDGAKRLIEALGGTLTHVVTPYVIDGLPGVGYLEKQGIELISFITLSEIKTLKQEMGIAIEDQKHMIRLDLGKKPPYFDKT